MGALQRAKSEGWPRSRGPGQRPLVLEEDLATLWKRPGEDEPSSCQWSIISSAVLAPSAHSRSFSRVSSRKTSSGRWEGHQPMAAWSSNSQAEKSACQGTALPAVRPPGASAAPSSRNGSE